MLIQIKNEYKSDGQENAAKWYPIAIQILHQMVTDENPVEFVPELLLPFSLDVIRMPKTLWGLANKLHARYKYFELDWLNK